MSHAVAARLVADPPRVLDQARRNLEAMLASSARGSARVWLQKWQELLQGPVEGILEALTSRSPKSRELRQNSPFAGVLTGSALTGDLPMPASCGPGRLSNALLDGHGTLFFAVGQAGYRAARRQ